MNHFSIVGRVAREVKLNRTGNDKAYMFLTVAVDGYWDREKKQTTSDFIDVTIWGKEAEKCKHLVKGSLVAVTGRIGRGKFADKNTGEIRYTTDLNGLEVQFLAKPKTEHEKASGE